MTGGTVTCTPLGGLAGAHSFSQGTANTPPNNSVGFQAPTNVPTAYLVTMPSAPAAGYVKRTNANPSVESVSAIAGTDLPNPSANTLGGVQSKDCSTGGVNAVQKINIDGTITCVNITGGGSGTAFLAANLGGATQVASGTTKYTGPCQTTSGTGNEAAYAWVVPKIGTLSGLTFGIWVAQPSTGTLTVTVRRDTSGSGGTFSASDTTLTCQIPASTAANTQCIDSTHTVAVNAGDRITLKLVNAANADSWPTSISVMFQ